MFDNIKLKLDKKNIYILGFGKEGRSTLAFLKKHVDYSSITVCDKNECSSPELDGVMTMFGEGYMSKLDMADVIIKTPGIAYSEDEMHLVPKTLSQTGLFLLEHRDRTIGITGTKGKSTTTSLISHALNFAGVRAHLVGNIGIPPLDIIEDLTDDSVAVFEMSCHQLEFETLSPHVAVVLNLFEDHLDHYKTREKYILAKENIFKNQKPDDCLFISAECQEQIKKATSKVTTLGYDVGEYKTDGKTITTKRESFEVSPSDTTLIGKHNLYNIMTAFAVTELFGVTHNTFVASLKTFKPLSHRLEFVSKKRGVDYYDDSISTVPETTVEALKSLPNVDSVLIGGMDRGIDYTYLCDYLERHPIKNVILMYDSGKRIAEALRKRGVHFTFASDLKEAVTLASNVAPKGSSVILSPAAASYGYFKNFEERGDEFKKLVESLSDEE